MNKSKKTVLGYIYCIILIILGNILNYFKIGTKDIFSFGSVGTWIIYLGFFSLIIVVAKQIWRPKKKRIDKKKYIIAMKAKRITLLAFFITAFITIIIDGIKPITVPYHLFMSYLVCGLLIIFLLAYKIILKRYQLKSSSQNPVK